MSTIKIFNLHNQAGGKFFLATPATFAGIQGQLTGYGAQTLHDIHTAITHQARLILPRNGQVTLNNWTGAGYVDYRVNGAQRSLGMIIGGGLNGGFASLDRTVNAIVQNSLTRPVHTPPAHIATPQGVDPVDLGSGAYLNRGADLIVAAAVARDLLAAEQPALKNWITAALVAQWATEQLLDKAIAVNLGDRALNYRQQPDGSFTPPPGVTTDLIQNPDGAFQLRERFGAVLAFNANNRIQRLTDIDGNALSFAYTNGKLSQVKDAYDRTLTLTYTGERLTQVADHQGRSVTYHYDNNGDLTGYRDAENELWRYGYDEHGKVIRQTAPRDNNTTAVYKLHYTGLSSSEEDPLGHRTTYTYDFTGRTVAVENALGEKSAVEYDGQGQVVKQTDALGHVSRFHYDGCNNLIQTTDALKQRSLLAYE